MGKIQIDIGDNLLQNHEIDLIEACVNSVVSGRFDQLKLLISDINSFNRINPINKVHDALYKTDSDLNKTIWDSEIKKLSAEKHWVYSALSSSISDYDRSRIKNSKLTKSSNIASFGSCFATNISKHFRNLEFTNTHTFRVEEAVNSPRLIDMYFNPQRVPDNQLTEWDNRFGIESKHILSIIPKIDLFILTFGVGWDLVDKDNNICLDLESIKSRLTNGELKFHNPDLHEQSQNISSCIQSIRNLNFDAPIIVTLSPVPLSGFFGEHHVFHANALSKSSLLLAIEQAKLKSDFIYVPTYEIVTSLAPILFEEKVWGEDGTSRHPNNNLIRLICESFIKLL